MVEDNKNIEFELEDPVERKRKPSQVMDVLKDILDGSLLTRQYVIKQLPFIFFISFLALIYIGNRYHAEKLIRQTVAIQKELKELKAETLSMTSILMKKSTQSEVSKKLEAMDLELEEAMEPPIKLIIKKEKK